MKREVGYYEDNIDTLSTNDLRTYNRYYLHPKDKRVCKTCKEIFDGIRDNFHIKKYTTSGISWNTNCKYCCNKSNRARNDYYRGDPRLFIKSKVASYLHRANEVGVAFDLDSDFLINLFFEQESKCYYTGEEISFRNTTPERNRPHDLTPSLDRLYPDRGYTKGNVVWCSYYINKMKSDTPVDEFYKVCSKILDGRN